MEVVPASQPVYTPSWDGQSRASSAGYSAAHSAGTQNTAATGVTHASVTAVASGGGAARPAGGRMRMMLPSPSRQASRPPSRAASVAGDFRRSPGIHVLQIHVPMRHTSMLNDSVAPAPGTSCIAAVAVA